MFIPCPTALCISRGQTRELARVAERPLYPPDGRREGPDKKRMGNPRWTQFMHFLRVDVRFSLSPFCLPVPQRNKEPPVPQTRACHLMAGPSYPSCAVFNLILPYQDIHVRLAVHLPYRI